MCAPEKAHATVGEDSDKDAATQETESMSSEKRQLQYATNMSVSSLGLLVMSTTLTMPYLQSKRDELGCDSVCQGSMTSARSTLTLVGAALVGRLSDLPNMRRTCLLIGVLAAATGLVAANRATTQHQLWLSLLPTLLQQSFSTIKALMSDYQAHYHGTAADRASSTGMIGMASGLAMMIGPFVGSSLLSTYDQTINVSLVLLGLSGLLTVWLPTVQTKQTQNDSEPPVAKTNSHTQSSSSWWAFLDIPSVRSPAAIFVLLNRLLSAFSYHMFLVIWPQSLRTRFSFGPREYGQYFSVVGLCLAISQGVLSKWVLQQFHGHTPKGRVRLLVVCAILSAIARYWAFCTTSLALVYVNMACFVSAMGVSATIVGADTSQIPPPDQVGSFFGIVAAVESGAGMVGPLLASFLASSIHPTQAPLAAVVGLNLISAALAVWGYERLVFSHIQKKQDQLRPEAHAKLD